ncbi:MAG: 50S ribosomal protein L33 [Myxococcales bacterium]|nr:50S ribosomal protein L33 [Myxococcales bacterium]
MPRRVRIRIGLECTVCGRRNYTVSKNRDAVRGTLVLKKYCTSCQGHTEHREGK